MASNPDDAVAKLRNIKADRFRVLSYIYDASGGSTLAYVSSGDVMNHFGMDKPQLNHIVMYLINEKLVTVTLGLGTISITHRGITEVEAALDAPDRPTDHFMPVNVINFHGAAASTQIQQGTHQSTQTGEFSSSDLNAVRTFAADLMAQFDVLGVSDDERDHLRVDLTTLDLQLESARPRRAIVTAILGSVRSVLENTGGDVAADWLKNLDSLPL